VRRVKAHVNRKLLLDQDLTDEERKTTANWDLDRVRLWKPERLEQLANRCGATMLPYDIVCCWRHYLREVVGEPEEPEEQEDAEEDAEDAKAAAAAGD